jgi:hypothetical protein
MSPVNLRGLALLDHVLDHIDAHPESWDQETYGRYSPVPEADEDENDPLPTSCNTVACIAGHTVLAALPPQELRFNQYDELVQRDYGNYNTLPDLAADLLQIPQDRSYWRNEKHHTRGLFHSENTREDLQRFRDMIAQGTY